MTDIYQSFIRAPNASLLASDAALNYVTTTTTISGADAIVKHLEAQARQVQKKEEKVLSTIQTGDAIVIETETTYLFQNGGGVFLPNMDLSLLANQSAVVALVHIVSVDQDGKISQIRLHWDQSTVLKQVDAIGKTGRNWPIRDGKAQSKTISDSVKASQRPSSGSSGQRSRVNERQAEEEDFRPSARGSARSHPRQHEGFLTGDEDVGSPGVRSPYQPILKAGAGKNFKPNRLFDDNPEDEAPGTARKAGAGKNFKPNRLFDESVDDTRQPSPERKKVDPSKYEHFELAGGQESAPLPTHGKSNRKVSNWDFDDFSTPAKHVPKFNPGQERHFGYGIDEDMKEPEPKREPKHIARPDAGTHFEISDRFGDDAEGRKAPLKTTTNVNAARRQEDRDPHFSIKDVPSPANENRAPEKQRSNTNAPLKPRNDMSSNWNFSEMEKEAGPIKKIYKTAGDGMGGRAGSRLWDIATDDAPSQYGGKGGEKQVYKTAGNGMGGRKGFERGWSIGDQE